METLNSLSWETLDEMIQADGPAGLSWFSRVHRFLMRRFPDRFVCRLRDDIEELHDWLHKKEIPREDQFLRVAGFDEDRSDARVEPENGWVRFTWRGSRYEAVSFTVTEDTYQYTYSWLISETQAAAEALAAELGRHLRSCEARVLVFKNGSWEEAPKLEGDLAGYSWDSMVLPEAVKTRLRCASEVFFRSGSTYRELGIPWKLGFLFVGPPGTGKTLTTKVLAATSGVRFLYLRSFGRRWGREANQDTVRDVFEGARKYAPCLLCLEDVDTLIREDLRSTFLNELDGLEEDYRGVLTVATTNHPEKLDAALLHRPSRFDYRFEFPAPHEEQRLAFVLHWMEKLRRLGFVRSPDSAVAEIVRRSQGMSHAYLKRVLSSTAMRMQTEEGRGDAAFSRIVLEELADAQKDRTISRRAETATASTNGAAVGFRME